MLRDYVYLYKTGDTMQITKNNLDLDILKAAEGPDHWCEKERAYIFTVDDYYKEVIQNKIKLF